MGCGSSSAGKTKATAPSDTPRQAAPPPPVSDESEQESVGTPPLRPPAQVQPETDGAGDPPGGGDGAGDDDERARLQAELARLKDQFTTGSKALTESNARSQELYDKISSAQAKADARKAELEKELLEHTERLAKYAKKVLPTWIASVDHMTSKIYYINTVDKTTSWTQPENFDGTFVVIDDVTGFTAATQLPIGNPAVAAADAPPSPAKGTGDVISEAAAVARETVAEPVEAKPAVAEPAEAVALEEPVRPAKGDAATGAPETAPASADAAVPETVAKPAEAAAPEEPVKPAVEDAAAAAPEAAVEPVEETVPPTAAEDDGNNSGCAEAVDIDLTDPAVTDAAVKIQSSFRGFKERKELKAAAPVNAAAPETATEPAEAAAPKELVKTAEDDAAATTPETAAEPGDAAAPEEPMKELKAAASVKAAAQETATEPVDAAAPAAGIDTTTTAADGAATEPAKTAGLAPTPAPAPPPAQQEGVAVECDVSK